MAWLLLIAAGLLEIVWAIALKNADGFSRLWPSLVGMSAVWISFALLAMSLRSLQVGTAYAVWILALGESASLVRLVLLSLILVGIVGLKLTGP